MALNFRGLNFLDSMALNPCKRPRLHSGEFLPYPVGSRLFPSPLSPIRLPMGRNQLASRPRPIVFFLNFPGRHVPAATSSVPVYPVGVPFLPVGFLLAVALGLRCPMTGRLPAHPRCSSGVYCGFVGCSRPATSTLAYRIPRFQGVGFCCGVTGRSCAAPWQSVAGWRYREPSFLCGSAP